MDQQKAGPINEDPAGPHERWYEHTWWGRVLIWCQRLSPAFVILVAAFIAIGFQFQTPAAWFHTLEAQIQGVSSRTAALETRVDVYEYRHLAERQELMVVLNALVRLSCANLTDRERALQEICDGR